MRILSKVKFFCWNPIKMGKEEEEEEELANGASRCRYDIGNLDDDNSLIEQGIFCKER